MQTDSNKYLKKIGSNIANIREQKGMTQYKFAKLLLMEQSNLARIEKGEINTTVKTLLKISDALEVDITKLFK